LYIKIISFYHWGGEPEIEVFGEAVYRILKSDPKFNIVNARQIVDSRNWVIHGYDRVDDVVIRGKISNHLPNLRREIEDLLKDE